MPFALEWKCRKCGEIELNPHSGNQDGLFREFLALIHKGHTIGFHSCKGSSIGASDLIGLVKLEEKE